MFYLFKYLAYYSFIKSAFTPLETLAMLDQNTSAQLKTLLERLESPIELVATLDGSDKSD